MSSSDFGDDDSRFVDHRYDGDLIAADDMLDDGFTDYWSQPRSVADTLLEVALFGAGPEAVRLLESLQGRELTGGEALEVAGAWERQARWMAARCAAANLAFVGVVEEVGRDAARQQSSRVLELALVIDCSDMFLKTVKLPQARMLATTLTGTAAMLESGELSEFRARRICDRLTGLDPQVAQAIEASVLPTAAEIKLASLTSKLRKLVLAAQDPAEALAEHLDGAANRRVRVDAEPAEPGLLGLHAYLPAEVAVAVRTALEAKAQEFARADKAKRAARKATAAGTAGGEGVDPDAAGDPDGGDGVRGGGVGERRTRDQRLADALAWFVLGPDEQDPSVPARPKFTLQLTMSLPVLLALRDGCAELPGYGPIPADLAREWAADADWQRFVHDPVTGYLRDDGSSYQPKTKTLQFTKHRDVHDRFPGSNRSAKDGDGDHVEEWTGDDTGGTTSSRNIANSSRIGHIAKTHGGWHVHGDANGVLIWTSPHGHTYRSTPHDYRDPEPPTPRPDPGPPPF